MTGMVMTVREETDAVKAALESGEGELWSGELALLEAKGCLNEVSC